MSSAEQQQIGATGRASAMSGLAETVCRRHLGFVLDGPRVS